MSDTNPRALSWDQRYGSETYAYGKEANVFFSDRLKHMKPGVLLLPGEGEGRNAAHAAAQGWRVEAFDQSRVGQQKALALASEFNVAFTYRVCDLEDYAFLPDRYDLVALLFFHADAASRAYLHRKSFQALKPGGHLLLEAFHKKQLQNDTGGPKSPALLYDEEILTADFSSLEPLLLERRTVSLDEGPFHQGEAEIIRYVGVKSKKL